MVSPPSPRLVSAAAMSSSRRPTSSTARARSTSAAEADVKHSAQASRSSPPIRIGGPKVRHAAGRAAYRSQVPASGLSTGQGSRSNPEKNASSLLSSPASTPGPGIAGERRREHLPAASGAVRDIAGACGSVSASSARPRASRHASAAPIAKGPMQHGVQPGRHRRCAPAREAASATARSTMRSSFTSPRAMSTSPVLNG